MNSFFCSSLLEILSNRSDLVNFKFGGLPTNSPQLQFTSPHKKIEYVCGMPKEYDDVEVVETLSKEIGSLEGACVIKKKLLPFGRKALMVADCTNLDHIKIYTNEAYETWSRLRGTCAVQPAEEIAATLAYAQLLGSRCLPIHCAAVSRDEKAAVIIAPSNTGKTVSTWRLVTEFDFGFVAEDIAIIRDGVIYGCPFTCTDVPDGVRKSNNKKVSSRLRKLFFPNQPKECLALYVDPKVIRPFSKIGKLFFLKRGKETSVKNVDRKDVYDTLLKNNCLEFKYRSHPLLLELWYRYGYPNVQEMIDAENSMLAECAENIESIVEIVTSDPTEFSRIIADQF